MAKVTVVETRQYAKVTVVDTRRYATGRLGEGMFSRECDSQGRAGCGCRPARDLPARDSRDLALNRGPLGGALGPTRRPVEHGPLGRVRPIARMLAPRENLERASRLVREDLRDCLRDAPLPDEVQQCLNICIENANNPDAPLDPMNASLDPRDGQRFGDDGDSCSRRRALAHDYLATRDGVWAARFQAQLVRLCDPTSVADALGVYSNPDAAPSMVTAWVAAASGYYGEYFLPYPPFGGRDTGGCSAPTRLATPVPGELGWESIRSLAAMGTPSDLGCYNIPRTVPRPTGVCARRISPERIPGRMNVGGVGGLRSLRRFGMRPVQFLDRVSIGRIQVAQAMQRALEILRGPLSERQRRILRCWFPSRWSDDIAEIIRVIELALDALLGADIELYSDTVVAMGTRDLGLSGRDADLLDGAIVSGRPAVTLPDARQIALLPNWTRVPRFQATRILHEAFHLCCMGLALEHLPADFYNAFRFQGLVSQLADLAFDFSFVQGGAGVTGCDAL